MTKKDFVPYLESSDSVVSKLESNVSQGLSEAEVKKRQEEYGFNELETEEKTTLLQKFIEQFKDFMIIVLLVAAAVSVVAEGMEGLTDAFIILLVVILNAIMGVFQEAKAEEAIDALRKMASPSAKVRRDGTIKNVKSTELVPGDIIILEAGDVVPADVRLIEASSLQIEEAALTGESVPSEKAAATLEADDEVGIGDRSNMGFSSTNVTYGRGVGVVTGTGMQTEVGHIATMLSGTEKQLTPLQRDQEKLGKTLTMLILGIAAVTFLVGILRGRLPLDMLLVAISLAVAAIPEGLPAISTIILSLGTRTMADRNALVRTLPAVETLGSTQVICSDKTGTLTVNKMTIEKVYYNGELHDASEAIDLNTPLLKSIGFANDTEIDDQGQLLGDPTETAMIKYALDKKFDLKGELTKSPRVDEVPFDSTRKLMSTIHQLEDGRYFVAVKGAPDQLIKRCTQVDNNGEVTTLADNQVDEILEYNTNLAKDALRVLAGAYKIIDEIPADVKSETIETDLIFAGLVGMIDPERKEAGDAIAVAKEAGIRTVMITGDH
ncbi:HAD-IC family P-type ATPase, partial [Globicatella sulfidifaciens]